MKKARPKMNIEEINKALKPLGVTFGELFRERYYQIVEIGFDIERTRKSQQYSNLSPEEYEKIYKKGQDIEKLRDGLIQEP
jgi:hypothetical protein